MSEVEQPDLLASPAPEFPKIFGAGILAKYEGEKTTPVGRDGESHTLATLWD